MKQCTKCKTAKPFGEFGKTQKTNDGYQYWCKSCCADYQRERRVNDPKVREYYRAYHRAYTTSRRAVDPDYHMAQTMRRMVQRTLASSQKTKSSSRILGYSAKELRAHLENQFLPGMSWENRSAWHIDHIKPVSAFIAEGIRDPKIINALSNLRPLWAAENISKGAR